MADFTDFQKLFANAQGFDPKFILDAQARNAEAFTKVVEVLSKTVQTVAQRQAELAQANFKDATAYAQTAFQANDTKAAFEQQAAFVKASADKAVNQLRELADVTTKGNTEALAIVQNRANEIVAEVQALIATAQRKAA